MFSTLEMSMVLGAQTWPSLPCQGNCSLLYPLSSILKKASYWPQGSKVTEINKMIVIGGEAAWTQYPSNPSRLGQDGSAGGGTGSSFYPGKS